MTSLNDLKCTKCEELPESLLFVCSQKHISCEICAELTDHVCQECFSILEETSQIQIYVDEMLKTAKRPCKYQEYGCTWKFAASDMEDHLNECCYRPYKCIGASLGVFSKCKWQGIQKNIEEHFKKEHTALFKEAYSYFQSSSMKFKEMETFQRIRLINAFSKMFLFYFYSNHETKMIHIMIIYFGRKAESNQYFYEFEIKPEDDSDIRKIKFVQKCCSDNENLQQLIQDQNCISLSHKLIKNYLNNGAIPFRFVVKKVDNDSRRIRTKSTRSEEGRSNTSILGPGPIMTRPSTSLPLMFNYEMGNQQQNSGFSSMHPNVLQMMMMTSLHNQRKDKSSTKPVQQNQRKNNKK